MNGMARRPVGATDIGSARATLLEVIEEVEVRTGALLASRLERFRLVGR